MSKNTSLNIKSFGIGSFSRTLESKEGIELKEKGVFFEFGTNNKYYILNNNFESLKPHLEEFNKKVNQAKLNPKTFTDEQYKIFYEELIKPITLLSSDLKVKALGGSEVYHRLTDKSNIYLVIEDFNGEYSLSTNAFPNFDLTFDLSTGGTIIFETTTTGLSGDDNIVDDNI